VEEYKKIDPITQIKEHILDNNLATEEALDEVAKQVKERVAECEKFANDSPYPDKNVMYDVVYEQENYPFISHKL
jgi:pyruvate dehydrogenase E1 component alpha subunit